MVEQSSGLEGWSVFAEDIQQQDVSLSFVYFPQCHKNRNVILHLLLDWK